MLYTQIRDRKLNTHEGSGYHKLRNDEVVGVCGEGAETESCAHHEHADTTTQTLETRPLSVSGKDEWNVEVHDSLEIDKLIF